MECTCGERMHLTDPRTLLFDYGAGSIEVRRLVNFARAKPSTPVWACYDCGAWIPTA